MDERRTLALLGWSVGGLVGTMFLLNALTLAALPTVSTMPGGQLAAHAGQPIVKAASLATARKAGGG